jgi:branched-chain amino acid aminotransferase
MSAEQQPRSAEHPRIAVQRATERKAHPHDGELGFGRFFTDHMFTMEWAVGRGWYAPRVVPYAPFALDPAAAVLHYGQALFDGFKAFRAADGGVNVFRLDAHCRRMHAGAERLCMPAVDTALMREGTLALIGLDRDWVPSTPGTALYVRPTLIGTEGFLGVRPSERYLFYVILSPVGAYYAEGLNPVKIWVEPREVRAAPGGLGAVKAAANYAASLHAAMAAKRDGYSQVLWLDAVEHKYLEEVGTMNLWVRIGDELATPPLEGTILAGVTRDSVIALAREWGLTVNERRIAIDEIADAHHRGTLREVFGSGTAAVISPVGELGWGRERMVVNGGVIGEFAQRLYNEITGIQYGTVDDRHGWLTRVP